MGKILDIKSANIDKEVEEYVRLREEQSRIKKRMSELSSRIKSYAEENGVKDSKGSYYSENANYVFGSQAKKSVSLDKEKTLVYLEEHNLKDAIKIETSVDEEKFEKYVESGEIPLDVVEELTNIKTTYAVFCKPIEEMPEVEEKEVQVASKKPSKKVLKVKK